MKRLIAIAALFLLMGASTIDAYENLVDIKMNNGDTVWISEVSSFDVYIENNMVLAGFSLGFQFWSPDGATWSWDVKDFVEGNYYYCGTVCKSLVPGSRMGNWPFDMTGPLLTTEQNVDELGRDTVMSGGVGMIQGMEAGPLEHMYSYFFVGNGDEMTTLCVDSCFVPPSGAFVFVDLFGAPTWPTPLWEGGGRCFPLKNRNYPPVWDEGLPDTVNFSYCEKGIVELSATDPEGEQINFEVIDVNILCGVWCTQVDDHGDGTMTLTLQVPETYYDMPITVQIGAGDSYHLPGLCAPLEIVMSFTGHTPVIDCSSEIIVDNENGYTITRQFSAVDPDTCEELVYSIISGPGSIDPATGLFSWTPDLSDLGAWEVCVQVSDGSDTDQCCFGVEYFGEEPFEVSIEKVHEVLQGHYVDVDITLDRGTVVMGGFEFLIGFDASALNFVEAALSDHLIECGWEYFTYRYNWNGNCGSACPTGLIRLIGLAETTNGPNHPDFDCIGMTSALSEAIASMTFFVSNDRTFECMFLPIQFYWMDCNDNAISDISGDSLYLDWIIYDIESDPIWNEEDDVEFPEDARIPFMGAPDYCLNSDPEKPSATRNIGFRQGGIDVICADSIDARGDINVNGVVDEIADAVMFTNYLISGLRAFGDHVEASIAASDVNADGIALSVADLVYLVRIITGDAPPYPKANPESSVSFNARGGQVTYESPVDIGAVLLVFNVRGNYGLPQLGDRAVDMDVKYARSGNELRVLIFDIGSGRIDAGAGNLVTISGDLELFEVEAASCYGFELDAVIKQVPGDFSVVNYPNPFNPATTISLSLPEASAWSVKIFNVAGQLVNEYDGNAGAGTVEVTWDGTDFDGSPVASGLYFYKAQAGQQVLTRKMILMK